MEGRHPDVLEMDAASNTGVDNMREIIESARYTPLVARYKVYLIDEVHMLSKGAFNALLKTLEEPPRAREVHLRHHRGAQGAADHAVALPALRPAPRRACRCWSSTSRKIVANEGGEAEDEALALIARAAEGSVRDGLSLLDQALGHGRRQGRGAAARARHAGPRRPRPHLRPAREAAGRRDGRGARGASRALHRDGAEPAQVLADLAEAVHIADPRQDAGRSSRRRGPAGRGAAARPRRWPSGCRWRS